MYAYRFCPHLSRNARSCRSLTSTMAHPCSSCSRQCKPPAQLHPLEYHAHTHNRIRISHATHTHSPKAGQGMNAGICDAHNLGEYEGLSDYLHAHKSCDMVAWKIAQVLHGHADLSLLKTVC